MNKKILELRREIDKIDAKMIVFLAKRQFLVKKIGLRKKRDKIKIQDIEREKWLKNYHKKLSQRHGFDQGYIDKIFSIIIKESRNKQKKI